MEVKEDFIATDLGLIPNSWSFFTIQFLIEQRYIVSHLDGNHGALYPTSDEFKSVGVPYIAANDFVKGYVDFSGCKYVSQERAQKFQKGIAKNGDILFAHNATVGPVAFLRTNFPFVILSTTATYFRCDNVRLLNTYLQYALKAEVFVKQYKSVMAQSTRFQVPITAQRKFSLPLPSPLEQTAIATALSDTDALINSLEKLIAKKRNIKQGVMQELLKPKKGWEVKRLGEILKVKHGKSQKEIERKNGKYPILGTGGLMGWTNQFLYGKESVLIGRKGTIDKPQFIDTPFWTVDTLFYTEVFNNFSPRFIYYNFLLIDWYSYNEASGVPSLNAKSIEEISIHMPPTLNQQESIAKILTDIDFEITTLEIKLEKCQKMKLGMMQTLLTGKIRLNHG